jgi:hypothetical protein
LKWLLLLKLGTLFFFWELRVGKTTPHVAWVTHGHRAAWNMPNTTWMTPYFFEEQDKRT